MAMRRAVGQLGAAVCIIYVASYNCPMYRPCFTLLEMLFNSLFAEHSVIYVHVCMFALDFKFASFAWSMWIMWSQFHALICVDQK